MKAQDLLNAVDSYVETTTAELELQQEQWREQNFEAQANGLQAESFPAWMKRQEAFQKLFEMEDQA